MVLRGPVRVLAATATRLRPFQARDLAAADRQQWMAIRDSLEQRRHRRRLRARFRRSPDTFLKQIEADLLQSALPA
jgi:hypothetical protein